MLQNRPTLRTIALAVALCAMSTTVCTTCANAKDNQKHNSCRQNDENKGAVGGNLSYLNVLGKNHYKNHKGSKAGSTGFETVGDQYSTSSNGRGYKIGKGNKAASTAKNNSKSNSETGNISGLGGFMKGKFDSSSNSNTNSTVTAGANSSSNSNSGNGSANAGFGFGLGNLFGGFTGSANGSATNGSANASVNGSANGSVSGAINGSLNGSSNGSGSASSAVSGLIPTLKPIKETRSNSSASRAPRVPKFGSTTPPAPVSDLSIMSDENVRGRQIDYNEYQQRLARWAATGQTTVTPGGSGTGVIPNPPIRRPFLVEEEENAKKQKNPGGGGSAGAGAGFLASTSGLFMQQAWNKMNEKSAKNDACQQRQPSPSNPNELYFSLPSADRTMRQMFIENIAGQDQKNKNCPGGGGCDTKGQEGNFNELKAQLPPTKAKNDAFGKAANFEELVRQQVGNSPEAAADKAKASMQSQCQGAGEAGAAGTVEGLEQALMVMFMPMSTINIANEAAGTPGSTLTPFRPLSQAIWMVQKMYKQVFMPMAILLLLPGALILNLKVMIQSGVNHGGDEDTTSPFAAIMRSIIAIFLIPATQLIVSYASDIGSAMTHEVSGATKVMALVAWAKTAMGDSMKPLTGEEAGTSQMQRGQVVFSAVMNTVAMTLAYGLLMLIAFQITIMCYLMCMGPIAAAFYVYPTGVGRLFKPVFANWVDAVINIALWKFWWCVIVLCMVTRINLMTFVDINPQWEAYMFVCFLVMMSYVPFCPFECKPGEMVDKILQKAQELKKSAGDQNG